MVGRHALSLPTIWLIDTLALLLNVTGIELLIERDVSLGNELKVSGVATLVAGVGGGTSGFQSLSLSTLVNRLGAKGRAVGFTAMGLCAVSLMLGAAPLALVPKMIVGGMLVFLGLGFLMEWLVRNRTYLPVVDYLLVWAILLAIACFGVLQGVFLGILAAIVIFVVDYSLLHATPFTLSGSAYQSHVERSPNQTKLLQQKGEQIFILPLQSVIFFGTAVKLLGQIRHRLDAQDLPAVQYIVLDFAAVQGIDSSAVLSFVKLHQLVTQREIQLVFTGLDEATQTRFIQQGILAPRNLELNHLTQAPLEQGLNSEGLGGEEEDDNASRVDLASPPLFCRCFDELTLGVAWCEDHVLASSGMRRIRFTPLAIQLQDTFPAPELVPTLMTYLQERVIEAGDILFCQGEPYDGLYFVEAGELSVFVDYVDGKRQYLRTFLYGTVIGEMGVIQPGSAIGLGSS